MHNIESNITYDRAARVARGFKGVATAVSLLLATLLAPLGQAQEKPSPASDSASDELEIVVTGTLIRGVAPIGTHVLDVSSQDITMIGATDTNQILAKIPQVSSAFNQVPSLPPGDSGTSIVRPNLRNLGAAGGTTTLVLVDGHRIADAGILITSVDPEVIAPGVIERIEVVPDGGSATYGSDAVGGVINLITRKRFDGFEVKAREGIASDYHSFDMGMTLGKDWGSGSAYLSYSYLDHSGIDGRERNYVRQVSPNTGVCSPGTVSITRSGATTTYALPGLAPNTMAICDNTDGLGIYPKEQRNSVFGSLTQALSSSVQLDIRAFFTRKDDTVGQDQNSVNQESGSITSSNPYYIPIAPDPGTQTVLFSYAGAFNAPLQNRLDEFGVTPSITAELGAGWQLRALSTFSRSTVLYNSFWVDSAAQATALAGTTNATALNPYDVAATNPAVLASIFRPAYTRGTQELVNERAIVDGSPFSLPGGDVKLAVGGEFIRQSLDSLLTGNVNGQENVHRTDYALFGETAIPLVGAQNAVPGVESLTALLSGRYDHYSDFGSTLNPKFGLTYNPVHWATLRANWGTSFNAPSMADGGGATDTRAVLLNIAPFRDPADPASNFNRPEIILAGGNSSLQPQKAHTWSIGGDIQIEALPDLKVGATYYNIDMTSQIAIIPLFTAAAFLPAYSQYVIKNPTLAQTQGLAAGINNLTMQ